MADEGYEMIGPDKAPPPAAIPAFPVANGPAPGGAPLAGKKSLPNVPAPAPPPAVAPPGPPPPAPAPAPAVKSKSLASAAESKVSTVSKLSKPKKKKNKKNTNKSTMSTTTDPESMMENPDGDGSALYQRPNTLDLLQISCDMFLLIMVIAVSLPVLMTAAGSADISFIKKALLAEK